MSNQNGVYPCYKNQFQINTATTGEAAMKTIADCESFSVSFDNGVEEWHPFDTEGWVRRLLTSKGVTVSVTAKRNVGDEVYGCCYQCDQCRIWRFHKRGTIGI